MPKKSILGLLCLMTILCTAGPANAADSTIAPSGFITSDGLRIHYESFGQGPPLILVCGWGADTKRNWIDTGWVDALKGDRLVISLEPRGHGQSDKPRDQKAYSYSTISRDVLALMDELKIAKADFMGYSMGSFMGAYLLGHHSDRFNKMIFGGIGDETDESKSACAVIAEALRAPDPAQIANPIGHGYRAYVDTDLNADRESLALSALQMWPEGYPLELGGDGLGRVSNPVLIVNGAEDHPYIDTVGPLVKEIPGARLVIIPGANHLTAVPHQKFKEAVLEFLRAK